MDISKHAPAEWHLADGDLQPGLIDSRVKDITRRQTQTYENMETFARLYLGQDSTGGQLRAVSDFLQVRHRADINVIASVVETVLNRTTARRIRPMVLSSGGKWDNRMRGQKLEKYLMGKFYRESFYDIEYLVCLDAVLKGIGYLMVGYDGKEVYYERIPPKEIIVDDDAAARGSVKEAHRSRLIPRHELVAMFPDEEPAIEALTSESTDVHGTTMVEGDLIRVTESWRLPCGSRNGLYTCTTGQIHLCEPQEWKYDFFPFVDVRYRPRPDGWIGYGIAEAIYTLQQEIDREVYRIQQNHDLHGDPPVGIDINSHVDEAQLEQVFPGRTFRYDSRSGGRIPQPLVSPTISPEFYNWINVVEGKCYDREGVSQLSARGQRPVGNDISALAYQVLEDIQNVRHSYFEYQRQRLVIETSRRDVFFSRDAFKGKQHKVKYMARGFMETVDWSDAVLPDDEFFLRVYPASILGDQPTGRITVATQLLQNQVMSPMEVRRELFSPDLEHLRSMADAPMDDIRTQIDQMLYEGKYQGPTKYQFGEDPMLPIRMVNSAYLRARVDGAPDDRLALLLRWLDEADVLIKRVKAETAPAAGPSQQPGPDGPSIPAPPPSQAMTQVGGAQTQVPQPPAQPE